MSGAAAAVMAIVAMAAAVWVTRPWSRVQLPDNLLRHPINVEDDFLSEESAEALRQLLRSGDLGDHLNTNAADVRSYTTRNEHIGEARPLESDGTCSHHFLIPNTNRTQCILPGRIDVAAHYLRSGGTLGAKEKFEYQAARLLSFGAYIFDVNRHAAFATLFKQEKFKQFATRTCPPSRPLAEPFQANLIVQVPGQTVAAHIDGVYFERASRFDVPQWLLAVMKFSKLFDDEFVPQIQIVAYAHEWDDVSRRRGEFVYWGDNSGSYGSVAPLPRRGIGCDGSRTVHAATTYRPDVRPPLVDKSATVILKYDEKDDAWRVFENGKLAKTYSFDDLRISVVYRARCFKDEQQRDYYNELNAAGDEAAKKRYSLNSILVRLAADLARRGIVSSTKDALAMPRLDLALLLLDTYVRYPLPPAADVIIPMNYCAAPRLLPRGRARDIADKIVSLIC